LRRRNSQVVYPDSHTWLQTAPLHARPLQSPLRSPNSTVQIRISGMGYAISGFFPVDFRGRYRVFAPDFGDRHRGCDCAIRKRRPSYLYGPNDWSGRDLNHLRSGIAARRPGSELARAFFTSQGWSLQPCVRPLDAVHMTAGHNALRGSGPDRKPAFENASGRVGCPDRRIDRLCITCCSPSQPSHHVGCPTRSVTPQARRVPCNARP
jgi:hypothetical protein